MFRIAFTGANGKGWILTDDVFEVMETLEDSGMTIVEVL